jgi:SAM-dependent methyltransferase
MDLNELARRMTPEAWIEVVLRSAEGGGEDERIPGLPSVEIQQITNSLHGLKTMKGAAKLYLFVAKEVNRRSSTPNDLTVLDFGCGWGRFSRFFPQLARESSIFGVDVDTRLIAACNQLLPRMNFTVIDSRKTLPFASRQFDFVFANSVFSHLNEEAHRFYIGELGRCTKPGGLFIATTMGPRNLHSMYAGNEKWLSGVIGSKDAAERDLNADKFAFYSTGRLKDYGITFLPTGWTKKHWLPVFDVLDVNSKFSQDVNIAMRLP